ncbi:MAG: hypothetical protein ACKOA9_02090 [Actinomycetota bacterium]
MDPVSSEPPGSEPAGPPQRVPDAPPTLPSRAAFLLAFSSILVAGLLGGVIGYGLGDISAGEDGGLQPLLWAVVGAVVAGGGVGIVAVLVLRAQAEWRRVPPPAIEPTSLADDPGPDPS